MFWSEALHVQLQGNHSQLEVLKTGPAEVEASTKARLSEKVNWRYMCASHPLPFLISGHAPALSVRSVKNGLW